MLYYNLLKYAKIGLVSVFIVAMIYFFISSRDNSNVNERMAAIICTKLVDEYVGSDFKVVKINYNYNYRFDTSKVDVVLVYKSGGRYISSCYFAKQYRDSSINVKKAELKDLQGKTIILEDLTLAYTR